jgi:hypothetical protein
LKGKFLCAVDIPLLQIFVDVSQPHQSRIIRGSRHAGDSNVAAENISRNAENDGGNNCNDSGFHIPS